eukprot:2911531-Pleurochrysis_carterae.AAC.5
MSAVSLCFAPFRKRDADSRYFYVKASNLVHLCYLRFRRAAGAICSSHPGSATDTSVHPTHAAAENSNIGYSSNTGMLTAAQRTTSATPPASATSATADSFTIETPVSAITSAMQGSALQPDPSAAAEQRAPRRERTLFVMGGCGATASELVGYAGTYLITAGGWQGRSLTDVSEAYVNTHSGKHADVHNRASDSQGVAMNESSEYAYNDEKTGPAVAASTISHAASDAELAGLGLERSFSMEFEAAVEDGFEVQQELRLPSWPLQFHVLRVWRRKSL